MKVLAISSSPRGGGQSKTEMLLEPLTQGMKDASAEVEVVYLRNKKIQNCIGCYTCWTKTPGKCILKDDMTDELFPKYIGSDIVIFATPLYFYSVTAGMKTFIDRTIPMAEPFMIERNGKSSHPLRCKVPKIVALSVAGFPEPGVFNELSSWLNYIYKKDLIAEIYRPGAESLASSAFGSIKADIFDALKEAGREIILNQSVSVGVMKRITQPLGDRETFQLLANMWWNTCIKEGVTVKEAAEKKLIPRAGNIPEFLAITRIAFKPETAAGHKADIQFIFTGEVKGECMLHIENGSIKTSEDIAFLKPDLTIKTPFELWMDIMSGKTDGGAAFIEGKYTAEGNLDMLMNFSKYFGADA
jgi:multimeric flavodoxin WrbA/putative sterol carrier protein